MAIHDETTKIHSDLSARDPHTMGALQLAFIGDTVYDLFARTLVVHRSGGTVHALHMAAAKLACAAGQAAAYRRIEPLLTEEEKSVFRRGRNAHSGTMPKNASVADYRTATGFETLIGFLYLSGSDARLGELMKHALTTNEGEE